MVEGEPEDPGLDKWAQRRARRARSAPPDSEALFRPINLDRAYRLWLIIGILGVLSLAGIAIIFAARNLRAGYRGARIFLTIVALPYALLVGGLASKLTHQIVKLSNPGAIILMLPISVGSVVIAASFYMWTPEVSRHFQAVRSSE